MCHTPAKIDKMIYSGVLYLFEQEDDMRVHRSTTFTRIRQWRREFMSGVHISTDVFFTQRKALANDVLKLEEKWKEERANQKEVHLQRAMDGAAAAKASRGAGREARAALVSERGAKAGGAERERWSIVGKP